MRRYVLLVSALLLCSPMAVPLSVNAVTSSSGLALPNKIQTAAKSDDHSTIFRSTLASRSSPVPPQKASDSNFVADDGGYLDYYLFREDVPNGRLPIEIKIDRYYSPLITKESIDSNGFLLSDVQQKLIEGSLLPEKATLTLQVFDVDHEAEGCPEVDNVYVNGQQVPSGRLTSGDQTWSTWTVPIPISVLKFPTEPGSDSQRPAAVTQLIEIDINTLVCPRNDGTPGTAWAVAVDWSTITIPSPIRPILFAHGWTGNTDTFKNFERLTNEDGIPSAGQPDLARGILPIEQTSPLLANAIKNAATRFGVDKVNIFAHSKGGLVARHALHSADIAKQVDHVVTFGSPHHGVDGWKMDAAIWRNCGEDDFPDASDRQNCVTAGQAIRVDDFRTFNYTGCRKESKWWGLSSRWVDCRAVYVRQNSVDYRTIVGGWFDIGDKNATYPWNADTQPFPDTASVDRSFSFDHSGIKENADAYRCGISFVDATIYDDCNSETKTRSLNVSAEPIQPSTTDQIVVQQEMSLPANGEATVAAYVDGGSRAVFTAFSREELTLTLRKPNGTIISPNSNLAQEGITYIVQPAGPMSTGRTLQYQVSNPDVGQWEVIAQSTAANRLTILGTVATTTALSLRTDKQTYYPGESVTIEAVLSEDENIVSGATFTGQAIDSGGAVTNLVFGDAGSNGDIAANDGIFTAQILAPGEGTYRLEVQVTKNSLTRLQTSGFAVTEKSAQIQAVTESRLQDTNSNGLADSLDIDVEIQVERTGHFELIGTLVDENGASIVSSARATRLDGAQPLSEGRQSLRLSFDGKTIRQHGVDGPYTLTDLVLYDQSNGSFVVDTATALFSTSGYRASQFERDSILFVDGAEALLDNDKNGLYDELVISVKFDLIQSGNYSWNGRLVDRRGREIGWYVGDGALDNATPATFRFDGRRIGRGAFQGPYTLRDVSLYKTSGSTANGLFGSLYTTTVRTYTVFDESRQSMFIPLVRR